MEEIIQFLAGILNREFIRAVFSNPRVKDNVVKAKAADLSHNRKKKYILEEGIVVPFLQDLGVMTQDGKIVRTKTDKFRQINRFLEIGRAHV